jgi:uncharacterized protein involved in response to NO
MSMPAALSRRRDYAGPVLFSYGFRPFFLAAGVWAASGILLWLPLYVGGLSMPTAFVPRDWHVHEMLYGYASAAIAGFLLTAVPNWTGRLPVNGTPLAALAALWLAGRVAVLVSTQIGAAAAAAIDLAFLVTLAAVIGREIVAGRNWRNLKVLAVLGVLILGNAAFHWESIRYGAADYGNRIAVAAVIMMIMVVGGRIVPSFTRNWLSRQGPGRLPMPFGRFDTACMVVAALALVAWVVAEDRVVTGALLLAAGLFHAVRLGRWAGDRTVADRLVLILHIGYAFVPLGFVLTGLAALWPTMPESAGIHAWTAGAIGIMPLAVMTRATLGHTGQPLAASPGTQAVYLFAIAAAILRICAAFHPSLLLLDFAGLAWVCAFGGFVVLYGPLLIGRPPAWSART